jgi:hypothetical protein
MLNRNGWMIHNPRRKRRGIPNNPPFQSSIRDTVKTNCHTQGGAGHGSFVMADISDMILFPLPSIASHNGKRSAGEKRKKANDVRENDSAYLKELNFETTAIRIESKITAQTPNIQYPVDIIPL